MILSPGLTLAWLVTTSRVHKTLLAVPVLTIRNTSDPVKATVCFFRALSRLQAAPPWLGPAYAGTICPIWADSFYACSGPALPISSISCPCLFLTASACLWPALPGPRGPRPPCRHRPADGSAVPPLRNRFFSLSALSGAASFYLAFVFR